MSNVIQKVVYNFSSVSPLFIILSFVWYLQKKSIVIPLIMIGSAIILIVAVNISFTYAKKNLAPIQIRTSDVSQNDGWIIAYIIAYLFPLSNFVISDFNIYICSGISLIAAALLPFVNITVPNPILYAKGYHFYNVSAENGVSDYLVISKRIIRRKQDLKTVKRIFEFVLLDVEGS